MKLPFSAYDFFGYLAPGTLGLCAIAVSTGNLWALQKTQPASVILLATGRRSGCSFGSDHRRGSGDTSSPNTLRRSLLR
jgi:hypothetical protein